ncbi:MAG: transcriptional regulator [Candidatus Sericytochromatia bacterium]
MSELKNNHHWEKIFNQYQILAKIEKDGHFIISSSEINKFREARLMTKFDCSTQLPEIFAKNNLALLPISRGNYIIANFKIFEPFEENNIEIEKISFPSYLESINYNNISSEAIALNCAYVSGMIKNFMEDEDVFLTVSGRMSSSSFEFKIKLDKLNNFLTIAVDNAQIEIDAGYESLNTLSLIEAKNYISKDFIIRQLYYPYRLWLNKKLSKEIKPIFLTYTNGIFHFREYFFNDPNNYNSIRLKKEKKYQIKEELIIDKDLIIKILNEVSIIEEPKIPFPQADAFNRIINLCEIIYEKNNLTKEEITINYGFDKRQTDYYTNAGIYLNLIRKEKEVDKISFTLTDKGKQLFYLSIAHRQIAFVKIILSHLVFNRVLKLFFDKKELPNKNEIINIMKNSNLYHIESEETFNRRASTISSWVNWILDLID